MLSATSDGFCEVRSRTQPGRPFEPLSLIYMQSTSLELDSSRQQAVNRAVVRLREQNALLVSEYIDLKAQIGAAVARLNAEERRISRAGLDLHPAKEGYI